MKNVFILGDSYSTYGGCIPDGYVTYYSEQGRPNVPVSKMQLGETWWKRMQEKTNCNILLNNSWSGSTISYTGREGDCSQTSSFIYRYRQLKENGFFKENAVDTVFLFGGTNDSWIDAPLGEMQFSDWEEKDLYNVLPAICYLVDQVKNDLPNAEIVLIINSDLKEEIQNCIEELAKRHALKCVKLKDVEKEEGHPTVNGMLSISEQVLAILNK